MRRQGGFTLVELLIAIGIMALLGAMASAMLNGALSNQEQVAKRQYQLERRTGPADDAPGFGATYAADSPG